MRTIHSALLHLTLITVISCDGQGPDPVPHDHEPMEVQRTSENLTLISRVDPRLQRPLMCGDEGAVCCRGPASGADFDMGPLVACKDGLGCDLITGRCVKPCGGNGQVCCDGPSTRALKWDRYGRVYSPSASAQEMCASGSCDQASHRCRACGNAVGAACCPPDAGWTAPHCVGPRLYCPLDADARAIGSCQECGRLGQEPCAGSCDPGLGVLGGHCLLCGTPGMKPCDRTGCANGCFGGLRIAKGRCADCGGPGEMACDTVFATKACAGQPACEANLRIDGERCLDCGRAGAPPCPLAGCDPFLTADKGICSACGLGGQPPCSTGCSKGLRTKDGKCTNCGYEGGAPCDAGCNGGLTKIGYTCQRCGSEDETPCPEDRCDGGLVVGGSPPRCVPPSTGDMCAPELAQCGPSKGCCQAPLPSLCHYGHCKVCVPPGEPCGPFRGDKNTFCCEYGHHCIADATLGSVCGLRDASPPR